MRSSIDLLTRAPLLGAVLLCACSSPPPAEAPPAGEQQASEPSPELAEPEPELSDEAAALIAETEGTAPGPAPASGASGGGTSGGKGYDFVYRVKPNELRIEVLSAIFVPTVKAVRVRGGWGVEVKVEATSTSPVSLAATANGPLAFAATVHRPSEEKLGDQREQTKDLTLDGGKPQHFQRTWPGPDQKPLQAGQELLLQVGLWGLGPTPEERKFAKKFFEVKLTVDAHGGVASVSPPK